jgi:phenylpropionate dioxygenase-like ring-hydroxylating dioxygenase large terminal subunit
MTRSSTVNRFSAGLVLFFLIFAWTIDLYWLGNHSRLPQLAEGHWMARIYRAYSTADHAYYDRVGKLEVGLEALNVFVTPLCYAVLLFGLVRRRPWRYALQLAVGSWVAYSVVLDFWIAIVGGYPGMEVRTFANYFKFYASNAPWLLGHLYLAFDAVRAILPVALAAQREDSRRAAPIRIPPVFESARNLRQKARAAGMNPNYWYPVDHERALAKGGVIETSYWNEPIALFRGKDGTVAAIENRCAHRQIKLSLGQVKDCRLVCAYHGWSYDRNGCVTDIPHDLFGREMPRFRVKSYPVRVRYGLIWIFPGDPALAEGTPMPEIPELEGPDRWACIPFSFVWHAHHSMIIDNLSDLTHGYLHRERQAFSDPVLEQYEARRDEVYCRYRVKLLDGPVTKRLMDRDRPGMDRMDLCFAYPYQWGNSADSVKHWILLLPIDERTTRIFFVFYFNHIKVPFTPWFFPRQFMIFVLRFMVPFYIKPLVSQDGDAVAWEQEGYEKHFDAPLAELCPVVPLFQELVVRKWEEHLASKSRRRVPLPEAGEEVTQHASS